MDDASCQLELKSVTRQFGDFKALAELDLCVSSGELVGVIGPNGAGKTTLFNVISGVLRPSSGQVFFDGQVVSNLPPHRIARLGIARSYQITSIFPRLTIYENLRIGVQALSGHAWNMVLPADEFSDVERRVSELLELVGLHERRNIVAGTLSHGDRRLVDLAMTLSSDPKVLLLDEPTAGMSSGETNEIAELIRSLSRGRTILLVEHDMDVVMSIATRVVVLARGRRLADGSPRDIQQDKAVQEAYFGGVL